MSNGKRQPLHWVAAVAVALSLGAGLSACTDSATNDLSPEDSNVFITNHDQQVDFSQYKTFSLPDSVLVESNDSYGQSAQPTEQQFVSQVATELTNRGFVRTPARQAADLGVVVTRVNNRYTGVTANPYANYYGNYWGGGFGSYYYDPFYYPSYYQYYQVSEQLWRIDIVDLKNRPIITPGTTVNPNDANSQLKVIYSAELRGNGIFDSASLNSTISAVFAQSPYLRTTR